MADDARRDPPGLPGSVVVNKFGDEIRNALTEGIRVGTADVRRSFAYWCTGALVGAALVAGCVSYLWPRDSADEWTVHHADGLVERCTVAPGGQVNRPLFTCRLEPQATK